MAKILLQAFNQGGLSDSKYSGIKNSFARMIGWDIHSKPGLLQVNQRMTKISGSTVDAFCKVAVDCTNGIRYWFSSTTGKIWQEKVGTWTLVYTTVPSTGAAGTLGAYEYEGFIYWATENWLHRIPINGTKADGSAAWTSNVDLNWQALDQVATYNGTAEANTYTVPTSYTESATTKFTFTPPTKVMKGMILGIDALGTGNWTIEIHDSSGSVMGNVTITAANMAAAIIDSNLTVEMYAFNFATPLYLDTEQEYHLHVKVSTGTSRVTTLTASDLSTLLAQFLTVSDETYKPMRDVNLVLYIGDRHYVHQVDAGTFSREALDLPVGYRVSALGKMRTDLLVGTIISSNVARCDIFRWNTYGQSFISQDTVAEAGINCFLEADNYTIISAGLIGNLYSYNGDQMTFYKKIPGTYTPTAQCIIYPNATALFGFLPIFGVSNVQGNPCDQLIYSLGKHSNNYTNVLNGEFPISEVDGSDYNRVTGVKIGAIIVSGNDVYVSWEYNSTFGVDKLDYANKIKKPILETRLMSPIAGGFTTFNSFTVTYEGELPANTSLNLKKAENNAAFGSAINLVNDSQRQQYDSKDERSDARTLALRLEAVTSSNAAPAVQEIIIDVN